MKNSYPVVLIPDKDGFTVYIPDFDINTQGGSITEAIEMARDAVGLMGIDMEDDGKTLPSPRGIDDISVKNGEFVNYVDVDFTEYRRKNDLRTVRKNCSLPGWLCYEAEKANLNFSQTLQEALKRELRISNR